MRLNIFNLVIMTKREYRRHRAMLQKEAVEEFANIIKEAQQPKPTREVKLVNMPFADDVKRDQEVRHSLAHTYNSGKAN